MDNNEQEFVEETKNGRKLKKIITIISVIVIGIVLLVAGILVFNSPKNQINRALDRGDLNKAVEIYIESDSEELSGIFKEYTNKKVYEYACGDIDFETINNIMLEVESIVDTAEALSRINKIKESKINYAKAVELISNEDYINALSYLNKVIEDDVQNYDVSIKKIDEALQLQLTQVKQYLGEEKYDSAYALISKIEQYEQIADEIESVKNEVVTEYSEKLTVEAQALYDNGEFLKAYKFIEDIDSQYLTDSLNELKNKAKTNYADNKLTSAQKSYDAKAYDEAIEILTKANAEISDVQFTNRIKEYKQVRNHSVISNSKSKVTYIYDSIEKKYTITPKGLKPGYISIGYDRNIQPIVVLSDDVTGFYLYWGFANDSWIFMEEIIIDCDGTQYSVDVEYFDRKTEVSRGDIMEAYGVADSKLVHDGLMDLEPMINSMVKADKVTIRFKGDGYLDKVIPKSHINEIYALWQIYKVLKDNPELISEL